MSTLFSDLSTVPSLAEQMKERAKRLSQQREKQQHQKTQALPLPIQQQQDTPLLASNLPSISPRVSEQELKQSQSILNRPELLTTSTSVTVPNTVIVEEQKRKRTVEERQKMVKKQPFELFLAHWKTQHRNITKPSLIRQGASADYKNLSKSEKKQWEEKAHRKQLQEQSDIALESLGGKKQRTTSPPFLRDIVAPPREESKQEDNFNMELADLLFDK